ncbi:MAG TPA: FAD-dependent oxidoreductase [Anaerolineae bacterium]|nr:FAD-dependent oxidoreductase [Anaerolineae bacterium]
MNASWQQLDNLVRGARPPRDGDSYDVIIVGAGMAGLATAYELRAQKPLVLEREPRVGGRVFTRTQQGISYDVGAVFAFDTDALPFPIQSAEIFVESSRVALYADGKLFAGADVLECCARLGFDAAEWSALAQFAANQNFDAAQLPPRVYEMLNAFFQVIYPGELRDYVPRIQRDAFHTFVGQHFTRGNQIVTTELERLCNLGARLRLGALVEQIVDEGEHVRVSFREADASRTVTARSIIVTTPAPITRNLVAPLDAETAGALDAVRYAPGIVVAFCVRGAELPDVGCVVTPNAPTSTIFIQHTLQPDTSMLLVYYAGDKAHRVWDDEDAAIARCACEALQTLPLTNWNRAEILFTDVQRWNYVGPVLDAAATRAWRDRGLSLTPRIILGGELASDSQSLPYGMRAAWDGGRRAAVEVSRILAHDSRAKRFGLQYLVDATIYHFTDDQPRYIERTNEGNIAFYGLILQQTRDEALKAYLLDAARDGLWEYQNGFGVTAEDSALVLEGLLECRIDRERLRQSAAQLVNQFYNREVGAFETVHGGRARYWRGPSVDATAHIGYLLHCIDPEQFAREIRGCAAFTASQQSADGLWQGRWFPSRMITTFYAMRLLALLGYEDERQRAQDAILKTQQRQGSWEDSVVETSAALLALQQSTVPTRNILAAMERGRAWLVSKKENAGWRGEPVLYYWYEMEDGTRVFYHCSDKGQVTSAWAMLALRR